MSSGPDATRLFQATTLIHGLKMWQRCKMIPTRGATITRMLAIATTFSGKTYKRSAVQAAIDDVQKWADTMKAALPVVHK